MVIDFILAVIIGIVGIAIASKGNEDGAEDGKESNQVPGAIITLVINIVVNGLVVWVSWQFKQVVCNPPSQGNHLSITRARNEHDRVRVSALTQPLFAPAGHVQVVMQPPMYMQAQPAMGHPVPGTSTVGAPL